jgi:hypothetical protein
MIVVYCDRGFYNDNDNCAACPLGTYKDVRGNANSCTMRNVKNKVLKSVHENDICKK